MWTSVSPCGGGCVASVEAAGVFAATVDALATETPGVLDAASADGVEDVEV